MAGVDRAGRGACGSPRAKAAPACRQSCDRESVSPVAAQSSVSLVGRARHRLRTHVTEHPALYLPLATVKRALRIDVRDLQRQVISSRTELVIEGYTRCGTHVRCIRASALTGEASAACPPLARPSAAHRGRASQDSCTAGDPPAGRGDPISLSSSGSPT